MSIQTDIIDFESALRQSPLYKAAEFQLKQTGQHYTNRDVILLVCMGVIKDNMKLMEDNAKLAAGLGEEPPAQDTP